MIAESSTEAPSAINSNIFDNLFRKVERAKQQWEATVDALPELICTIDADERLIRANRTLERWQLGDVTRVTGRDFHDLLHPDCPEPDCYLPRLLASLTPWESEGGKQLEVYDPVLARHVLLKIYPIPENGVVTEVASHNQHVDQVAAAGPVWAIILLDISEHKRMVASLRRQSDRLETINGISRSILAAESPHEMANSALEQIKSFLPVDQAAIFLMNRRRTHLELLSVAQPWAALTPGTQISLAELGRISSRPLDRSYYVGDLGALKWHSEMEEHCYNQGIIAYANLPLTIDQRWLGSLTVGTRTVTGFSPSDLNVLAEVADLLTVALHQSQLRAELEDANEELQRNLRAKQDTMQDLSHELRSPLALIHGFVDLLRDGSLGPLTMRQERALSIVEERGDYLLALVERLLLLQTVGDMHHNFEPTDISTFLQELISPWQLPARNHDIDLKLDLAEAMPTVEVDPSLLPQVISNLLDNALKFTPAGGTIVVSARATADEIVIVVADNGVGIPRAKMGSIFKRYEKGKKSGGAGIGLALCRAVMNAHGGTISATSAGQGKGSTFTLRFPSRRQHAIATQFSSPGRPD